MQESISIYHFLILSSCLFSIGAVGIFVNRKNLILILICMELMLLSVNINFVAFSVYLNDLLGQVFAFFVLTVAASEAAIGLAILVAFFRLKKTINVSSANIMKN